MKEATTFLNQPKLNYAKFDDWFKDSNITLDKTDISFLDHLIAKHAFSIETYTEETFIKSYCF